MKVLIADKFPETHVRRIKEIGYETVYEPGYGADDIAVNIADKDVVVVRSTRVTAEAIQAAAHLSLILRAGAGTNNIDKEAASEFGIYVANCPGMNSIAVAELAMGLICALDRRIVDLLLGVTYQRPGGFFVQAGTMEDIIDSVDAGADITFFLNLGWHF